MNNPLTKIGVLSKEVLDILGDQIVNKDIYCSNGLKTHMIKRKHFNCLKYLGLIPDIISNPDYIGSNPGEAGVSIELIKRFDLNVLVGIKLSGDGNYLYVATMHDIQEEKISRRLQSGRLKIFQK